MAKLPSLSVFFPAFNEAKNLPELIKQAYEVLPQLAKKYEVIVVNDGSVDNTQSVVNKLAKNLPHLRLVNHDKNRGYGAALRTGFESAVSEWVFFSDADLQFDLHELKSFIPFTDKYKVIIGYRTTRADGKGRHLNAWLFKFFIDTLFRLHVKDIDCAFKLFKNSELKKIALTSSGAFTSSELLYKLKKERLAFKQLPVSHYQRKYGNPTGANFKVIVKAGLEALRLYTSIKINNLKHFKW